MSAPGHEPRPGLTVCRACGCDFVHAADWHTLGASCWWVLLRCGECDAFRPVVLSNEQARDLDLELDRGMQPIAAALRRIEQQQMADQAAAFIAALQRDLIDAADFRRAA